MSIAASFFLLLALALPGCKEAETPTATRLPAEEAAQAPVVLTIEAATYEERLVGALQRVAHRDLSAEAGALVAEAAGTWMSDVPGKLGGMPEAVKAEELLTDPALRALLLANDEGAAAKALAERGVKGLVLHRDVAIAVDRDRRVLSRLYHHGHLDYFRLARVGEGTLVYTVHAEPVPFPPALAQASVDYLRARLGGAAEASLPKVQDSVGSWAFFATLRTQGREQAIVFARSGSLKGVLDELVEDLEVEHRRRVEILGHPRLSEAMGDMGIELHRVTERAYVEPRDEETLQALLEPGIDGVYMMSADKKERAAVPGSISYTRNLVKADDVLREAAKVGRMSEKRPWRDAGAWLELVRTISYRHHPDTGLVPLYRGVPPVDLSEVTLASTRESILSSGDWWLANLAEDGSLNYKFWPAENRYSNEYNHVRHTLATWNLVQAWRVDPTRNPAWLEGARKALDWTNLYLKHEGDMSFYSYGNNQKLGSVVVNLMGMIDLAKATGSKEWDDQIRRQARFALFMQKESGTFDGYYVEKGHPYYGQTNDIVPGEAALALVMVADYFDEDEWIATLPKFFEYYEPWFRTRAARRHDRAWPVYIYDNNDRLELVQFGPWTVMAANAYHARTGDERVGAFGLEIARWMIEAYMYDSDRTPYPDYIGGYYKMPGELPAMQAFCYAEGTAAAYALARRMGREEDRAFFELRTRESVRFALVMQYDDLDTYPFTRPELLWGGIRYAMNESKVRIDYTYHGQSALVQWYEAALEDPALPAAVRDGPVGRPRPREVMRALGKPVAPGYRGAVVATSASGPEQPASSTGAEATEEAEPE